MDSGKTKGRLLAELDDLVASVDAQSHSDVARRAFEEMIDQRRRRKIGESIADAYRQTPETDDELVSAARSTRMVIAEEPW